MSDCRLFHPAVFVNLSAELVSCRPCLCVVRLDLASASEGTHEDEDWGISAYMFCWRVFRLQG